MFEASDVLTKEKLLEVIDGIEARMRWRLVVCRDLPPDAAFKFVDEDPETVFIGANVYRKMGLQYTVTGRFADLYTGIPLHFVPHNWRPETGVE